MSDVLDVIASFLQFTFGVGLLMGNQSSTNVNSTPPRALHVALLVTMLQTVKSSQPFTNRANDTTCPLKSILKTYRVSTTAEEARTSCFGVAKHGTLAT